MLLVMLMMIAKQHEMREKRGPMLRSRSTTIPWTPLLWILKRQLEAPRTILD